MIHVILLWLPCFSELPSLQYLVRLSVQLSPSAVRRLGGTIWLFQPQNFFRGDSVLAPPHWVVLLPGHPWGPGPAAGCSGRLPSCHPSSAQSRRGARGSACARSMEALGRVWNWTVEHQRWNSEASVINCRVFIVAVEQGKRECSEPIQSLVQPFVSVLGCTARLWRLS